MSRVANGTIHEDREDKIDVLQGESTLPCPSNWTAAPDLLLVMVPTVIVLACGTKEGGLSLS
jgi:hypothetical protein